MLGRLGALFVYMLCPNSRNILDYRACIFFFDFASSLYVWLLARVQSGDYRVHPRADALRRHLIGVLFDPAYINLPALLERERSP